VLSIVLALLVLPVVPVLDALPALLLVAVEAPVEELEVATGGGELLLVPHAAAITAAGPNAKPRRYRRVAGRFFAFMMFARAVDAWWILEAG
jgi:hypothetical protein